MKKTDKDRLEELAQNVEMLRENVDLLTAHLFLDDDVRKGDVDQLRENLYMVTLERTRTIRDKVTVPVMLTAEEVQEGGDAMTAAVLAEVEDQGREDQYMLLSLAEDVEVVDVKWKF